MVNKKKQKTPTQKTGGKKRGGHTTKKIIVKTNINKQKL